MLSTRLLLTAAVSLICCTSTACSSTDDAPPVGTVSVTAERARVPIGSPLELVYRFEVSEALADDYTVFVHMVDADGEIRWNDDHLPPVPTSTWAPGTPVEYSRTTFLPAHTLYPGDVTIEVGLYRDDARLPLQGPRPARRPGTRAYPVVDLQLAPESERIFLMYPTGWYPDEFSDDQPPRSWKWTEQSAALMFRHPKGDATLLLEYAARPDLLGGTPQQVTFIGANNQAVTSFPADSTDRVLRRIPLTREQMGTGDVAELRIEVDRTFVPAEVESGSQDTRRLGLQVYQVFVQGR